jgi:hypothetical protein
MRISFLAPVAGGRAKLFRADAPPHFGGVHRTLV